VRLAQYGEAAEMIDVRVGEEDPGDRGPAARARLQRGERLDLLRDVGRDVDEPPALAVGRERDRGLRAARRLSAARRGAVRAGAIPLRYAAARGRAEDANDHACAEVGIRRGISRFPSPSSSAHSTAS
jgi:hypothetical protein